MMPLVGCNTDTNAFHTAIAKLACDLNATLSAFRGNFAAIYPEIGEPFDAKLHVTEGMERRDLVGAGLGGRTGEVEGRNVLFTALFGVRERVEGPSGGREWRTCVHAKVRMWPVSVAPSEGEARSGHVGGDGEFTVLGKRTIIDIS